MENIWPELKISELKQRSLHKAYEEVQSQASSVLIFSIQWKDLETHFGSTRKLIETALERLMEREKDVISREKELEAKGSELNSKLALKETQLAETEKMIGELSKVLESNMKHVESLQFFIQEKGGELGVKETQYGEILKSISEKEREFDQVKSCIKEGEEKFDLLKSCIEEKEQELEVLEKRVKQKSEEVESKGKELDSIRRTLRGYKDDIELKDRKFNAIRRSLEDRKKEIELREGQLRACQSNIEDCDKEIKVKEEKLNSIRNSIVECSNELELKEKRLGFLKKEVELKEKNIVWLEKLVDQCALKFETKEKEFQGFLEKLEMREQFCESKFEELGVFEKKVNDWLKEVESQDKNLGSLQKSVNERTKELEKKEIEFEKRVNEFKLRNREFDSSQESTTQLRAKEKATILYAQVKIEQMENTQNNSANVPSAATNQYSIPKEGKDLQLLLNRHLKAHDLLCSEISKVLQDSLDPAKLVLDAMQGFYPSNLSREGMETFDVNIVRRSCILLLEKLMEGSPPITRQVKEEAIKLAFDWKAKMTVANDNYLQVLGFMQFLASYRLASAFDPNELSYFFDIVCHRRQASELHQFLCPPDQPPENPLANVATSSSNSQLSTQQNNIVANLQTSPEPAKFVLESIQGSIYEHWKRGDVVFEASVVSNYISVFEELFRMLPQIQPLVKVDAMKFAAEWKAKMRTNPENSLEVLSFLQFLTTYGLLSSFDEDEILKFLETISQHKEALDLCCTLSFAKKIPEFIQNLIRRKKLLDAVRLICAFKSTNRFSPVPLLTRYMEDLKNSTQRFCREKNPIEEKEKVADEEIAALGAVIQCIKDYNLDSKFPSAKILERITLLERIKRDRRRSATLVGPNAEQKNQQPLMKRQRNDSLAHYRCPTQGKNKFPRTSASNVRPRGPPVFPPPMEFPPASLAYAGDPRQFGLGPASGNMVSPNVGAGPSAGMPYHV